MSSQKMRLIDSYQFENDLPKSSFDMNRQRLETSSIKATMLAKQYDIRFMNLFALNLMAARSKKWFLAATAIASLYLLMQ
jgi:hypothetical protein